MHVETTYGDIRIHGTNCQTGTVMYNLGQIMGRLNVENLKISDIKISLTFSSEIPSDSEKLIIDSEDLDKITGYKYICDENRKRLLEYLRLVSYDYMTLDKTNTFIKKFLGIYNSMESGSKFVPPNDDTKFCIEDEPLDINQYFQFENIPYRLRSIHNGKYQLVQEHLSAY